MLVAGKADLDKRGPSMDTPLLIAAFGKRTQIVESLLRARADATIVGEGNRTVGYWAKIKQTDTAICDEIFDVARMQVTFCLLCLLAGKVCMECLSHAPA